MKAQILKIAGVKTEAEFYKKFPTEEAFIKKHGKELKKAQSGIAVANQQATQKPLLYNDLYNNALSTVTGVDPDDEQDLQNNQQANQPQGLAGMLGQAAGIAGEIFKNKASNTGSSITDGNLIEAEDGYDLSGKLEGAGISLLTSAGPLIGAFQQLDQDKKDILKAKQSADISGITAQAAASRPEPVNKKYVRPEDALLTNPMGKGKIGAGVLKKGGKVKGNPTEIQNTYDPYDIYTDQGYLPIAAGGVNLDPYAGFAGNLGGALGSATRKGTGRGGAASQIGSTLGGIAGSFIPIPGVGTALGSLAGGYIGGLFDADTQNKMQEQEDRMQENLTASAMSSGARSLQMQNKGFMENGGYMNPEYNPQVIAKFGDYDVDQLLAPPYDADMLRAGGHLKEYTPPSERAMYTGRGEMEYGGQMAMGGDLRVHRGEAETMSYNPYLPDGGETIMFRGPSHDNGGMPISFGENGVEVEGGEPAIKLQDGGSPDGNLVVYGNMVIPDYGATEIGDEKAKGKKFKHYVADLSKVEAKQNKLIDKTTLMLEDVDENDPFDQFKLNVGQANLIGANMKLKSIAEKKKNAATVQNAILDTAEEQGLESDALAKGKIKYAKANDPYAEFGAKLESFQKGGKKGKNTSALQGFIKSVPFAKRKEMAIANGIKNFKGTAEQNRQLMALTYEKIPTSEAPITTADFIKQIPFAERKAMAQSMGIKDFKGTAEQNAFLLRKTQIGESRPIGRSAPAMMPTKSLTPDMARLAMDKSINKLLADNKEKEGLLTGDEEKTNWWDVGAATLASAMPFIRPSNQMPLDASQLQGEMYAMANNQEEPVYAQTYNPLLSQTTNISLQDQLNEITSQSRAAERMAQNNPAALAMIASQASEAKNKVLGEQFRLNQGEQQRVMETNRQTMNDAQLKNLSIFDQQQQRQAQARSNTKQQAIVALNSISDKIQKNRLENRELAISENLYNYRFTPKGVAYNINAPQTFAPYGSGSGTGYGAGQMPAGMIPDYEADESGKPKVIGWKLPKETKTKKRNGSIVQAIKNL
jgi:hypothetical protein